jgi:hypothetical protein
MVATINSAVFWDVTLCGSCKNQHSSEMSVLTRATWYNILQDGILHKKYIYHNNP